MVLTNAEVRPRPRPVSAITPDTPLHEVAINTWMCVERMVTPRQRGWRIGRAFCQRASPSPFSLEDPADTADSYACWTDENGDEAAAPAAARPHDAIERDRRQHALELTRAAVLCDKQPGRLPLHVRGDEHRP